MTLDERASEVASSLPRSLLDFDVEFRIEGHKSSEGDGRTAADIEREMKATESPDAAE